MGLNGTEMRDLLGSSGCCWHDHAVFDAAWRYYDSQPTPKPKSALQHTEKNKIFKILGLA